MQTSHILLALLLLLPGLALAQVEICDNGVDDNGNGLIDLNDPFCNCQGIFFSGDLTQLIPNPSFEDQDCCPQSFSYMQCLPGWENGNSGTTDYMHTCGFIMAGVQDANLVPFPNGQGIVGAVYTLGYKEYLSACLAEPFIAGSQYTLTFRAAFVSVFTNGQTCVPPSPFDPAPIALFGHPTCDNLTVGGTQCPSGPDPNWVQLGVATIQPLGQWMEVQIDFTPATTISAIMLGPPCVLPANYTADCQPYIVYDDLQLFGEVIFDDAEVVALGLPCDDDFSMLASIDFQGPGQWQWYFNGVALSGQNDPLLLASANNFQSGSYQAVFSTPDGCIQDSVSILIPSRDTVDINVSFCPGGSVGCAGQDFSVPGLYEVTLLTDQGCDSLVRCNVVELVASSTTVIEIDTCGPFTLDVCGTELSGYGSWELTCIDSRGCDSIVQVELRVLEPQALIFPPGVLACDPAAFVLLDGSLSPLNPVPGGATAYQWSGPAGGIQGDPTSPVVEATLPGQYCLTLHFGYNGVECSSTTCVSVNAAAALPDPPTLEGPAGGCPGDTLAYQIRAQGNVPVTGWQWVVPSGLNVQVLTDSTLLFPLGVSGTFSICALTRNECGASDTVCIQVLVAGADTLLLPEVTCDPAEAGVFETTFPNQFGCDSVVVRTVSLAPSYSLQILGMTCDPAQAGSDTLFLTTAQGCDSIVILRIDLLPSQEISLTLYTCDPAAAGMDTLFLQNAFGCDSTVYIDILYTGQYLETQEVLICAAGADYTDTLLISGGPCDSLFLTIYRFEVPDTVWLSGTTCDPSQAGVQITVLAGSNGCDSTVIRETLLLPSDALSLQAFTCDPAGAGVEVLNLQNQYGCDSLVTITTLYVQVDTQYVSLSTCDAQQSGVVVDVLSGPLCDTVRITTTTWIPSSSSRDTVDICGPGAAMSDTLFLQNAAGCDSLVIRLSRYHELLADWFLRNESCADRQDGSITITQVLGGLMPLAYRLDQGTWQATPGYEGLAPGTYTLYVRDARGCVDTLAGLVVGAGIDLSIDAGPDQVVSEGAVILLNVQSSHALAQIIWQAQDPLDCSDCPSPRLGPVTGDQTVRVTGVAAGGCTASDELLVRMNIPPRVYVPSSFSPNADGINDILNVFGNAQVRAVRNMAVYDRWGNALFTRNDLPVNDPNAGWDGSFRDRPMDPGVYIWVVEVEMFDGRIQLFKGDVTLVR